ncbi:MAG: PAS domain S-box protein [Bacteroidia bacterium]|nr:PAS domain S-box protein [Bacteroidia bacterium]
MKSDSEINILLVEDNPADQFFVAHLLKTSELKIKSLFTVDTTKKAIHHLKEKTIDLVLLDLSLPDSSGIKTFKTIKAYSSTTPVVVLSGLADMDMALVAITLGAQDYLIKGEFNEKMLTKTILYSLERVQNLKALEESNERYNLVSQATNDMVWDWNLLTGEFYRNKEGWRKIFGIAHDNTHSAFMKSWTEFVHPDDNEMVSDYITGILKSVHENIFELENRALREDGTTAHVLNRGYLIRDENGRPIRLTGATQDITEKKIAEVVLKASEERYRYLFNNNPACIFLWDPENLKILEVNDTATKQYGYTQKEFLELNILDIRAPEDHSRTKEFARQARKNPKLQETSTFKFVHKTGEVIYMDTSCHTISYSGVILVLVLANNVTGRLILEKELEAVKLKKQLEITDAVISAQEAEREEIGRELHDNINQILVSSRLYLGLSKTKGGKNHSFIDETDKLLNTAIEEIRNLSHRLVPPSLHGSALIKALAHIFDTLTKTTGQIVYREFDGFDENTASNKFKLNIYRIVQEQFTNIHKYAKANSIHVKLVQKSEVLMLSIKDDGIGFDTSKKANGLGLRNIKTRAFLFNGEMTLVSSPGNGCELSVTFPMQNIEQTIEQTVDKGPMLVQNSNPKVNTETYDQQRPIMLAN